MTQARPPEVLEHSDGTFTVVEWPPTEPVTLGTFDRRDMAEVFAIALLAQTPAETVAPEPAAKPVGNVAPPAKPEQAPAKPKVTQPAKPTADPVTPGPEQIPDRVWAKALDSVAAGERLKSVAARLGVPFNQLRGRWASAIKSGTHTKTDPIPETGLVSPEPEPEEPAKRVDDKPVSGGVGAVLQRGKPVEWHPGNDEILLAADPENLRAVAGELGISLSAAKARKAALEVKIERLMTDGAEPGA